MTKPDVIDISASVESNSSIPISRLRIANSYEDVRLTEIARGIVFVYAAWSARALQAFRRFTRLVKPYCDRDLELVVLNTEALTRESAATLFGSDGFSAGGYGEVVFIREGRVIARLVADAGCEERLVEVAQSVLGD